MTSALKLASGTVGAPGAVFSVDATSGLYKTTSGIGVAVGGVQVAEFLAGGIKGARFIGELIPYTGSTAPGLCVLPFGQTLSRTAYPDLWAFAQVEIAAGSLLYNNGDASTTFGIMDMRGREPVCADSIGGSATANRTTNATMTPSGTQFGSVGGGQTSTLGTTNLPPYTPSGSVPISNTLTTGATTAVFATVTSGSPTVTGYGAGGGTNLLTGSVSATFNGNAQGGTSTPLTNMPPSIITNYLLFAGA